MKIDTHLNILVSYAYLNNDAFANRFAELVAAKRINLMIDSGAFTKHNATSDKSHITLDNYCRFLDRYGYMAEKYVMLDVVGKAEQSKSNYEIMRKRGFAPMFVMTMFDRNYAYMRDTLNCNPNICVAGGVTTKGPWMTKRFQDIYRESHNKAKIHGLGYVTFPKMLQLPLHSVDSSSWSASIRFGALPYFENGMKGIDYRKVLRGSEKLSFLQKQILASIKVSPSMFCRMEYHRGQSSIGCLLAIKAHQTMQKYCKRHGLEYFLAVATPLQINQMVYVSEHYNDLSYEKFRNEFVK